MQAQATYECTVCGFNMEIMTDVEVNEIMDCFDCGTEYEIVSVLPIQLVELEAVAEDWGQ